MSNHRSDGPILWAVRLALAALLGLGAGYVWGCNNSDHYHAEKDIQRLEHKLDEVIKPHP